MGAELTQVRLDDHQRITQATAADGTMWSYARDQQGRITSVVMGVKTWSVAYDADGKITALNSPEGPVDLQDGTASWNDLTLVLRSPGKPDQILVADPRR